MISSLKPAIPKTLLDRFIPNKFSPITNVANGCEYCTVSPVTKDVSSLTNWSERTNMGQRGAGASINLNEKVVDFWMSSNNEFLASHFTINYCPKCGRKLN